jgi:CheY-like chemotaxis protein
MKSLLGGIRLRYSSKARAGFADIRRLFSALPLHAFSTILEHWHQSEASVMRPSPSLAAAETLPLPILIVEDNPATADSFARLLGASGHNCRIAHSGWHVLQTALGFRPKVILLDIALPGITGYEIATELRQHPALKSLVQIAVSGYAQDTERSLQSGFDYHLVKPVDFQVLQEILAGVAASKQRNPDSRSRSV